MELISYSELHQKFDFYFNKIKVEGISLVVTLPNGGKVLIRSIGGRQTKER